MSAKILSFSSSSPEPVEAADEAIDKFYVRLVYCLAGCPDRLPVHPFEEIDAARLGSRLLTE
jgi:hypothetical protein